MDGSQHKTAIVSTTVTKAGTKAAAATPMPKLKDSCDTCAASKIRCDKQKPLCGRCERLGYPCFYSPARRIGYARPRGIRTEEVLSNSTSALGTNWDPLVEEGVDNERVRRDPRSIALNTSGPTAAARSGGLSDWGNGASRPRNDTSHAPNDAIAPKAQIVTAQTESKSHSRAGSTESVLHRSDCAGVAMGTLLQLELAKLQLQLHQARASETNRFEAGSAHGSRIGRNAGQQWDAIETVAVAFRTLSTILLCPCFERQDTGLLVAAVCLSMLDVYSAVIGHSSTRFTDPPVLFMPTPDLARGEDASTTDRVLEELPKLARLVLQITRRYRDGDAEKDSSDFLQTLAHLIRLQLHRVTAEATA